MQILTYILIIFITFIGTGAISKLVLHLFTNRHLGYTPVICTVVLMTALFYLSVLVFGSLAAFTVNFWLGIIISIFLLIGTIGSGFKDILKDARHSMQLARDRRA